jgi:uncharacterized protein YuzE
MPLMSNVRGHHVTLAEFLPQFTMELRDALAAMGEANLADQLQEAKVVGRSYDPECTAGYIRLESARQLNVVERNVIGANHGRTIEVPHRYWVNVDVDNFNRISGVELLSASEFAAKLSESSVP